MQGTIRVYETVEKQREKAYNGKMNYFLVTGKLAGHTTQWMSDIHLAPGDHVVACALSEYAGKLQLRIVDEVKAKP